MTVLESNFPANATMFFCVGAQKAGTTWLFNTLRRSDQIHFNAKKELHYFNAMTGRANVHLEHRVAIAKTLARRLKVKTGPTNVESLKGLRDIVDLLMMYTGDGETHAEYIEFLLRGYNGQPVIGDITPGYSTLSEKHFADMAKIGNAKFIYILRDPVDRMWSQIRMSVRTNAANAERDYDEACISRARDLIETNRLLNISPGNYQGTITKLEKSVPRDRIKYVFFERLFEPETIADICAFLGVDAIPSDPDQVVGLGRKATLPEDVYAGLRKGLDAQYQFIFDHLGDDVPSQWTS